MKSGDSMNPMEEIREIYKAGVEKADEAGLADIFKSNTEVLFEKLPFTVTDIAYLDGYFIFGYGTNSVVHFHVAECQGWKFGIWWDANSEGTGEFFTQFEDNIDKFKPSASYFHIKFSIKNVEEIVALLKKISEHPAIAFYEDAHWCLDVTDEEAQQRLEAFKVHREKEHRLCNYYNQQVHDYLTKNILPLFNNAAIEEDAYRCPCFELVVPLEDNTCFQDGQGFYEFSDEVWEAAFAYIKELEEQAKKEGVYWLNPLGRDIYVYSRANQE